MKLSHNFRLAMLNLKLIKPIRASAMTKGFDAISQRHAELRERASFDKFTKKFSDIDLDEAAGEFQKALTEFHTGGLKVPFDTSTLAKMETVGPVTKFQPGRTPKDVFDALTDNVKKVQGELEAIGKKEDGEWVLKEGKTNASNLKKYESQYLEAQEELSQFLRGEEVNGHTVPKQLAEAFAHYEETLSHAEGTMNGWFAHAQLDGVRKAANSTMKEMAFWEKGNKARGLGFAKSGVAVGGAAAIMHGVAVGKGSDGEERNGFVRLGEILLGAGAIGGALIFGKAR